MPCPSFPFKLQHNCPPSLWHLIICSASLLPSASSWLGRTTASSGCSTGRRAEEWPWRPGGRAASLGLCCGPGGFTPAASGAAETSAWIVWTSPKRSCTWPGTHQRTSSPSRPPTTCIYSRIESTPTCRRSDGRRPTLLLLTDTDNIRKCLWTSGSTVSGDWVKSQAALSTCCDEWRSLTQILTVGKMTADC